jgi:hypothetical protein
MNTYKIEKDGWYIYKNGDTIEIIETWVDNNLGDHTEYTITEVDYIEIPTNSFETDKAFGGFLVDTIASDLNPYTAEVGFDTTITKFNDTFLWAPLGFIPSVRDSIDGETTDTIFTSELKTKYLDLIDQYLLNA